MNKVLFDLENCFGIGKFYHEFDFPQLESNTVLIYAPNGTMKSSFAKTLELISKKDKKHVPCDNIYVDRVTRCEIAVDGNDINPEVILVVSGEDTSIDSTHRVSSFIASSKLKKEYDIIYHELDANKNDFIKKLKLISQSSDCEGELMGTFKVTNTDTFYSIIERIFNEEELIETNFDFRYNDVFDKGQKVEKFVEKNKDSLEEYYDRYNDLLKSSGLFNQASGNSFGTHQASELLKSVEDNAYFDAKHSLTLSSGIVVTSSNKLKELYEQELQNILNDTKLKKTFEIVDKGLNNNVELRSFRKTIEKDNSLLAKLNNYKEFKKETWLGYIAQLEADFKLLVKLYESQKENLSKILAEASKEVELWKEIIEKFNRRFYVPFKVVLKNQADIILKQEQAALEFIYQDEEGSPVIQNKENLLKILSKGEQRAYFILQFLFEIESRKNHPEDHLIVFDDIADSFDYKNKFAIVEYIQETHYHGGFKSLILTHNYDFYRTIFSRLSLPYKAVFIALRNNRELKLAPGQYKEGVFNYFVNHITTDRIFVSLIPFIRNIIEYTEGQKSASFIELTDVLHLKDGSNDITVDHVYALMCSVVPRLSGKTLSFLGKKVVDFIYETVENLIASPSIDEVAIENKICLSIAIRLKAENYMISRLKSIGFDTSTITKNQTSVLFKEYSSAFTTSNNLAVLQRVNLMTPENIHINSFMFEPIIDMSSRHLIDLYSETKAL